jgi:outer membrane protein OmpA-like peptidoglycan-associated protein
MKIVLCFAMLAFMAGTPSALGQTPEKVFDGASVTSSDLVDALTPLDEPVRTRGIGVERDEAPAGPPREAKASLLITFETNSAALTGQARRTLDVVGEALQSPKLADFRFSIQGHADPRGNPEKNLQLSQLRAESVRAYLVTHKQIQDERLQAIGKGDTELMNRANPIAPENRRVTIVNLARQQ